MTQRLWQCLKYHSDLWYWFHSKYFFRSLRTWYTSRRVWWTIDLMTNYLNCVVFAIIFGPEDATEGSVSQKVLQMIFVSDFLAFLETVVRGIAAAFGWARGDDLDGFWLRIALRAAWRRGTTRRRGGTTWKAWVLSTALTPGVTVVMIILFKRSISIFVPGSISIMSSRMMISFSRQT